VQAFRELLADAGTRRALAVLGMKA
jgi:hypothetical protein